MARPAATLQAALRCHPSTPPGAVRGVTVSAARPEPAVLQLEFVLDGDAPWLAIPPPAAPRFVSGLWRHTCFEAFVTADPAAGYLEYNLAPSGEWAAFAFNGYRAGMRPLADAPRPTLAWSSRGTRSSLTAVIELAAPALAAADADWRLGLAAVIEDLGGGLSYWALAHPAGRPDFHDLGTFTLTLESLS